MIYKPQINNTNFVYPNFDLAEYDVDIIHTPNDNSVFGAITTFFAVSTSSTSIQFTLGYQWALNNAERYINPITGRLGLMSMHMMTPNVVSYKPWKLVNYFTTASTGTTVFNQTPISFNITPSILGEPNYVTGRYYIEFRFIGANSIYPVSITRSITVP
jgi:hypothetical protein